MSRELFRRSWRVQIDTLDVSNLPIEFKILSTIKPYPNKCVLTVWNMNQDHRAQLLKRNRPDPGSRLVGIPMQIEAGYPGNTSILFSGDAREVGGQREPTNWKMTLSGDDGGRSFREARIESTFTRGTPIGFILQQCATALGIGTGNAASFETSAEIAGIGSALPHTMTLSGNVAKQLTRLLGSMGLSWSVQRGALQILKKGKPLDLGAILISPETGLIGSPEASIDATVSLGNAQQFAAGAPTKAKQPKPRDPSIIKLKTFLIPGIVAGRKIALQSREFNGGYGLTEVESVGQSWGQDWHHNCVARVY